MVLFCLSSNTTLDHLMDLFCLFLKYYNDIINVGLNLKLFKQHTMFALLSKRSTYSNKLLQTACVD